MFWAGYCFCTGALRAGGPDPADIQCLLVAGIDVEHGNLQGWLTQYSCFISLHPLLFIPAHPPSDLTAVSVSPACPGRWYIREGWLSVVPAKGEELKRRMFFLFSDILIAAKPCHPLHLLNSNKLSCQAVYPLHQCSVDKVFGHTWSQGGLLSVSLPTCARQSVESGL